MTTLSATHQAVLSTRGIHPDVAAARGYRTTDSKAEIGRSGFSSSKGVSTTLNPSAGHLVLLIPIYSPATGARICFQARPDAPREIGGRVAKYELPGKQSVPVDANPLVRTLGWIDDPTIPVIITEGVPKADSILSAAVTEGKPVIPISLVGVAGARTRIGGKLDRTLHPDLAFIRDRTVYIAFDSDWRTKDQVYAEAVGLAYEMSSRGCTVQFVDIPEGVDGSKMGADDWLVSTGSDLSGLLALSHLFDAEAAREELRRRREVATPKARLSREVEVDLERNQVVEWRRSNQPGGVDVQFVLADFAGWVEGVHNAFYVNDDGGLSVLGDRDTIRVRLRWTDDGRIVSPVADIPVGKSRDYATWVSLIPGLARRVVDPSAERWVLNAILSTTQTQDDGVSVSATVTESGWVVIPVSGDDGSSFASDRPASDDRPHMLHYVGRNGIAASRYARSTEIHTDSVLGVDLSDHDQTDPGWLAAREEFVLLTALDPSKIDDPGSLVVTPGPVTTEDGELYGADAHVGDLWRIGVAWVMRAILPLPAPQYPLFLVGSPGMGKSSMARVIASGLAPRWGRSPFASFRSTPVGLELALGTGRHTGACIDDLAISNDADLQRHTAMMDAIVRGVHDKSTRHRGTKDLGVRSTPPPQSALMFTGEQAPASDHTKSLIERMVWCQVNLKQYDGALDWVNDTLNGRNDWMKSWNRIVTEVIQFIARTADEQSWDITSPHGLSVGVEQWLGKRADGILDAGLNIKANEFDPTLPSGWGDQLRVTHPRTWQGVRELAIGAALFDAWSQHIGVIDPPAPPATRSSLAVAAAVSLLRVAKNTVDTIKACDPAGAVVENLRAAIMSRNGCIVMGDGSPPPAKVADSWGWAVDVEGRVRQASGSAIIGRYVVDTRGRRLVNLDPAQAVEAIKPYSKLPRRALVAELREAGALVGALVNGATRVTIDGVQVRGVFVDAARLGL